MESELESAGSKAGYQKKDTPSFDECFATLPSPRSERTLPQVGFGRSDKRNGSALASGTEGTFHFLRFPLCVFIFFCV